MPLRKTAVALPEKLLAAVDEAAAERGESRNAFVIRVLSAAVRARRDRDITRRLNELFADPAIVEEDRRTAEELASIGVPWSDERW